MSNTNTSTPQERAVARAKDAKDLAAQVSIAEREVRNLRDLDQEASGRVREWATRLAKDNALIGFEIDDYIADIHTAKEAFANYSRAAVECARLRRAEEEGRQSYMQNQGRA